MKRRNNVILALAVTTCAISCQKDGSRIFTRNSTEMLVTVSDGAEMTKSENSPAQEKVYSMPFITDNGDALSLDVFISDMPQEMSSPVMTKGQVITNGNIPIVYGHFKTSVFKDEIAYKDEISTKTMTNVVVTYANGKWTLGGGPYYWPEKEDLTFCSMAPANPAGVSNLTWTDGGSKLSFEYSQSAAGKDGDGKYHDAENQQDLLFAIDTQNRTDNDNHALIVFSHALTAVQFIKGDIQGCTIETISLKNFKSSGKAAGTVSESEHILNYSWSEQGTLKDFVQTFGTAVDAIENDNASLDPTDEGTYTFMMIPQVLDKDATVEINVSYNTGRSQTISLNLGSITAEKAGSEGNVAKLKDWSTYAGKVITLRVNRRDLEVSIDDEVNGNVKENVVIKNTVASTVKCYIRALIIGNWHQNLGTTSEPVPGAIMAPWSLSNGTFVGLPTTEGAASDNNWILGADGFYYYKYPVYPDTETGTGADGLGTADKLFTSYTAPEEAPVNGSYLNLSIVVQAVMWDEDKTAATQAWGETAAGYLSATDKGSN